MSVYIYITIAWKEMWASAQMTPQGDVTDLMLIIFTHDIRLSLHLPKFTVSCDELEVKQNFWPYFPFGPAVWLRANETPLMESSSL